MSIIFRDYWVKGDTFGIKDELKEWGCIWYPEKKMWRVCSTHSQDTVFKHLKLLGCELIPVLLPTGLQKIQDILNRGKV